MNMEEKSKLDLIMGEDENKQKDVDMAPPKNALAAKNSGDFIGEALSDDEKVNEIMNQSKPIITVLVGFVGYGKTSFLASCYQILLDSGSVGDYKFVNSDTLIGLEKRLYLRRYNERVKEFSPTTARTRRGEPYLLDFAFIDKENKERLIVLSDHSGEDYQDYVDKKGRIDNDKLILNADRILFFIDSEKLIKPDYLEMYENYKTLLLNMKHHHVFSNSLEVDLLFNKIDVVQGNQDTYHQNKDELRGLFEDILERKIEKIFEVQSNKANDNIELNACFEYIVSSDSHLKALQTNNGAELDWVRNLIKGK